MSGKGQGAAARRKGQVTSTAGRWTVAGAVSATPGGTQQKPCLGRLARDGREGEAKGGSGALRSGRDWLGQGQACGGGGRRVRTGSGRAGHHPPGVQLTRAAAAASSLRHALRQALRETWRRRRRRYGSGHKASVDRVSKWSAKLGRPSAAAGDAPGGGRPSPPLRQVQAGVSGAAGGESAHGGRRGGGHGLPHGHGGGGGGEGSTEVCATAVGSPHTEGTHSPPLFLSLPSLPLFLSPSLSPRRHPAARRHLSPRPRPLAAPPSFYSPLGTPSTPGRHRHPRELPRAPGTRRKDSHTGSCTGLPRLCPCGTEQRAAEYNKGRGHTPRSRRARPSGPQPPLYAHTCPSTKYSHDTGYTH